MQTTTNYGFKKPESNDPYNINDLNESLDIIDTELKAAALALGESTARAAQRIPDAHCNGDMHAALEYAQKVKHEQAINYLY